MHRSVVAKPHHISNAARIATIGLIGPRGQEALSVTCFDANCCEAALNQRAVQPFGQRAGLYADERDALAPARESLDEWYRLALSLALPYRRLIRFDNADGSELQRNVQSDKQSHIASPLLGRINPSSE